MKKVSLLFASVSSKGQRRSCKPNNYWKDEKNILAFLSNMASKLQLKTAKDWNAVTQKQIKDFGGYTLLNTYSMHDIKCLGFPEGEFVYDKPKQSKPFGYWNDKQNILQFLEKVKEIYSVETPEDWNSITKTQFRSQGGGTLLNKYSMNELKCMVYAEHVTVIKNSKPKRLRPSGYWKDEKNETQFFSILKETYNLQTKEQWNSLTQKQIKALGGGALLKKYSMYEIKSIGFPEGKLFFDKPIVYKPPGYWKKKENISLFLDELKEKFNLNSFDDWNKITTNHIQLLGGRSLLKSKSIFDIKCLGFPEGISKFDKPIHAKPPSFWENEQNRNEYFEYLKDKFNLRTPEDWKRLSRRQIKANGGVWLFSKKQYLDSKLKFACTSSPSFGQEEVSFSLRELLMSKNHVFKRSAQRWLFLQVQKLFPGEEIVEDYFHSELSRKTGATVQFDVYLIQRNVAIEYHGKQHYEDIPAGFASLEMYNNRDLEKKKLCKIYGIQLVIIPYWWDNDINTLKNTLQVVVESSQPITNM